MPHLDTLKALGDLEDTQGTRLFKALGSPTTWARKTFKDLKHLGTRKALEHSDIGATLFGNLIILYNSTLKVSWNSTPYSHTPLCLKSQ